MPPEYVQPMPYAAPPTANVIAPPSPDSPTDKVISEEIIEVDDKPPPKLWNGSFDLGLNGSEGNSRLVNFRFNSQAKRATPRNELTLKSNYVFTRSSSQKTAHRLFFDGRAEWLAQQTPWTIYIHETTEYDEFQAWDVRISGDAGLGYRFLKNELTTLTGRFGPGAAREFGGPNNAWSPELVFNVQAEHQLTTRQKIALQVDYFPDWSNFGNYRINTQASWAIVIDEERNLSLKLSAIDRYNNQNSSKRPNDLDYAATLLWSF